VRYLKSERR